MATPAAQATNKIRLLQGGNGQYPTVLELIPGRLRLTVHHHTQFIGSKPVGFWTFESSGLLSLRQKEIILSLKIKDGEPAYPFPKTLLRIFLLIYKQAMQQHRVYSGDVIKLGEQGVMGFIGLGFAKAEKTRLLVAPSSPSLAGIFLYKSELLMAHRLGLARVLASLGWQAKRHPCPLWNDRDRARLPMEVALKNSQIGEQARKLIRGSSVHMADGEHVIFIPPPELHQLLSAVFNKLNGKQAICLISTDIEDFDGSLVWMPATNEIEINIGAGKEGNTIAGGFLYILPNQANDGATLMEDGFLLSLTEASWDNLKNAVLNRMGITLHSTDGEMDFIWRWRGDELLPVVADPSLAYDDGEGNIIVKLLLMVDNIKRLFRRG